MYERTKNILTNILLKQFLNSWTHVYLKTVTIRPNNKPWYDSEIRRCTKYRDRQRRIAKKKSFANLWKDKKLRNKVNNLKLFKRRFFTNIENKIEDFNVNNTNNYWKSIKDLMKNYKSPYSIPVLKRNVNGVEELCFIDEDKSNCLNNLFVSVSSIDSYKTFHLLKTFELKDLTLKTSLRL